MKNNTKNTLAFYRATVTELNAGEAMNIVGGTEDMPVPTVIQALTQIRWITFI